MARSKTLGAFAIVFALLASAAASLELLMVERQGCHYCIAWKETIGPIYPKTTEGKTAPLVMADIDAPLPDGIALSRPVVFTPTFVLIDDGIEQGRIEGYPGEDFFWALLGQLLQETTEIGQADKTH